jgi:hypothetical protein
VASLKRRNFRTPPGSGQGRWRTRMVVFDEQYLRGWQRHRIKAFGPLHRSLRAI